MEKHSREFIEHRKFEELYKELSKSHSGAGKAVIPDETLQAIGLMVVKFQRMEHSVRMFIKLLSNLTSNGNTIDILISKHSFKNLVKTLLALARNNQFHRMDDLKVILDNAMKSEEIRNQIVHSVWTAGPRFKSDIDEKKGLVHKIERYDEGELRQLADKVDKIDTGIQAIMFDYIEHAKNNNIKLNGVRYVD